MVMGKQSLLLSFLNDLEHQDMLPVSYPNDTKLSPSSLMLHNFALGTSDHNYGTSFLTLLSSKCYLFHFGKA